MRHGIPLYDAAELVRVKEKIEGLGCSAHLEDILRDFEGCGCGKRRGGKERLLGRETVDEDRVLQILRRVHKQQGSRIVQVGRYLAEMHVEVGSRNKSGLGSKEKEGNVRKLAVTKLSRRKCQTGRINTPPGEKNLGWGVGLHSTSERWRNGDLRAGVDVGEGENRSGQVVPQCNAAPAAATLLLGTSYLPLLLRIVIPLRGCICPRKTAQ